MKAVLIGPLLALLALSVPAIASPITYQLPDETAEFKQGPGVETAVVCQACHSADYISTQPSKKGKAFWGAEVQKMIKVFKAPIADADAATITDYLATNY
jgi:sulfite dehydrogenase (cytochrome) subunit B